MADIYDRGKGLAIRMLAPRSKGGKGLEMTLIKTTEAEYNPDTSTYEGGTVEYQSSALRDNYAEEDIDNTNILTSDVKFIISPVQLDGSDMPRISDGDQIVFNGDTYSVVNVSTWNFAGLTVGFEVQARS